MSYAGKLIIVLILAAAVVIALASHRGYKTDPIEDKAADCASFQSNAASGLTNGQQEDASGSQLNIWPTDNSRIYNNRPCFRWQESFKAHKFRLELSRNPSFSDPTFSYLVPGVCFRPASPLDPGDWYWRVRTDKSMAWSPVRHFIQLAPESADTLGPEITPFIQSITTPDQTLPLTISDPNGVLIRSLSIQGIKGKAFEIEWRADQALIRPSGGWPKGAHRLRVHAADQLGNETVKYFWVVVAPAPPASLQWVSRQGVFDGKACQFPMGIFNVNNKYAQKVKKAGFNLVHNYWWEISPDNTDVRDYLDEVSEAGLKAFLGFDRGTSSKQGLIKMNLAQVAERIAKIRDHPALLAWYLFDEPDHDHQYVAPRNLKILYRLIKRLDPYHPIVVTLAWNDNIKRYGKGCYDVYWIMAYGNAEQNDKEIVHDTGALGQGHPFLAILKSWDASKSKKLQAGSKYDDKNFHPNYEQLRVNAYLALTYASSGLCWWWYGDDRKSYVSVGDIPEAWDWLSRVVKEINQLSPVLSGPSTDLPLQIERTSSQAVVRARAIKSGSRITLIAVNPSPDKEVQAAIKCPQMPGQAIAKGKFGTPNAEIKNRTLNLSLPPLAAYIFEIEL